MSITLKELYDESKNKYKLKLLAGSYSIDNVVSWVHFMEDDSTINFIRGNELILMLFFSLIGQIHTFQI